MKVDRYKPRLGMGKMRDDRRSLWVTMPNGDDYNIWDVPPENLTKDVLNAIRSAFVRGMEAQKELMLEAAENTNKFKIKWEEVENG